MNRISVSDDAPSDWQKVVGRNADLQKAVQFSCLGGGGFGVFFGVSGLAHQLYYYDGRITSVYFSAKEYADFMRKVGGRFNDKKFVDSVEREITGICGRVTREAAKVIRSLGKNPGPKRLLKAFDDYDALWNEWYPVGWAFFFMAPLEDAVRAALSGRPDLEDCLRIIGFSDRITPVMESEIAILKLAKELRTPSAGRTAQRLAERFGWMPVYNTEDEPKAAEYYIAQAKLALDAPGGVDKKLSEMREARERNARDFAKLLGTVKDPLARSQIRLMHAAGYLRDMREEVRDKMTMLERPLYEAIAKHAGLALHNVVFLSNGEITGLLTDPSKTAALRELSQKRWQRYCFTVTSNALELVDDDAKIGAKMRGIPAESEAREVRGQVAMKHHKLVTGAVKIVLNNKELHKVKEGDILVAAMTKPDYLPAMRRAAAFVTDEGGVTCHAAIVSRELNKPCVTGTKIATKAFKDGDIVEVDAVKGTVRLVKRA